MLLNRMRAGFRRCFNKSLQKHPKQTGGALRLRLEVGPNGEVTAAKVETSAPMDAELLRCLEARAQSAQFNPPDGGSAELIVPFNLKP
jgi:outer membrane biosynthesis protein TonB